MPHLYIARHGETDFNKAGRLQGRTDIPLNEVGRGQATKLAERLRGIRITRAGASTLSRAKETASICAKALGVPCEHEDEDFRERHYGVFEGLTRDELVRHHADAFASWQADNRFVPDGAEGYDTLSARMKRAVERLALLGAESEDMLIVSHGGAMRALFFAVTGELTAPLPNGAVLRVTLEGPAIAHIERLEV